jgi:pimeloyl-ACP methyl ester carboxylesterase
VKTTCTKRLCQNFLQIVKLLGAGVFFTALAVSAQSQTPPSSPKIYHPPRTLPLTRFYDTPDPLPPGKPGELIRSEEFDDYQLPNEVTAFRILYHSRSTRGEDVAVSGVVLIPNGTPPPGGWPVLAWAHNFNGSARPCAPSLGKNLIEGPLLSMYTGLGYAVVASDYAGLGTNFPHAALDLNSNALDVIYSVPAAHAALPQLGSRWLVAGYSVGALVAAGAAESGQEDDPNYLGALAISGVAEPEEFFGHLAQGPDYYLMVFLARGIKTVFPEFRVEDMLTDKAMRLYEYVGHACDVHSGPELQAGEILKSGWQDNRYVKEFFARNTLGQRPAHGPLLAICGEGESLVPAELTAKAVTRLCAQKDRVLFVKYPGLNASAVLGNSVSEQASWIRARFAGRPAPGNCP